VRVVNDHVNVIIVLGGDATKEHGLYVSVPISSYAPGLDGRFAAFEKLSQPEDKAPGVLYRYRLRNAKAAVSPHAMLPRARLPVGKGTLARTRADQPGASSGSSSPPGVSFPRRGKNSGRFLVQ
jgi:hypothetical protein